ncbi:MAG: SusC/RagA family TonB-linked outer membrane protein, partial [Niabella sp.]|nr:SusC/RagA family TonB-linked outer membrane protein [Niabella sp.]
KGAALGTVSRADGTFSMSVPASAKSLVVSFVGYTDQTAAISGKDSVLVSLVASSAGLNEVVVIGYGTARKKDVTGSVAQVSSKDFTTGNLQNTAQAIQGKVPGLVVTIPGGDPNANISIRLRGQTSLSGGQSPLIVVDGVPLDDANQFANIPSDEIASIDILKDASASAIYGSRGSNGVINVILKKGAAGRTQVSYTGSVSVDKVAKIYDMANRDQWIAGVRKLGQIIGNSPGKIDSTVQGFDKGGNSNWQDALLRTALSTNHALSISGGSGGFSYRASGTYLKQDGIVINTGKEQVGLRFNAQQKALDDKLTIYVSGVNTVTNRKLVVPPVFYYAYSTPSVYPVYNSDGSYYSYFDFALQNPVQTQMLTTNKGTEKLTVLTGKVDYQLFKTFSVGVLGALNYFSNQTEFFQPVFPVVNNPNSASLKTENNDSKHGDFHMNYVNSWGKSNFNATAVYEYNYYTYERFSPGASQMLLDNLGAWNLGAAPKAFQTADSYKEENKLISFLGRFLYNWDQKYYVTASVRQDGSSKLGKKWGTFPSASVAWRLSRENFLKNASWINELKLSAGWGITGDQENIFDYSKYRLYGLPITGAKSFYDAVSGQWLTPYASIQNANPNLQWEQRNGRNVALDFGLLNNRLTGNINYFNDISKKLLYIYTLPFPGPGLVVNTTLANVGTLTNKGVELALNYAVIRKSDFSWNVGGQFSTVKTRVTNLSGKYNNGYAEFDLSTPSIPQGNAQGRGLSGAPITYILNGYTPNVFYMAHYVGLDSKGNELFDMGDGKTTTDNTKAKLYYTDPAPKFTYGFRTDFTYKNWALGFFFRGVGGAKIYNNTGMTLDNINRFGGNNGTAAALTNGITNSPVASDHWLEKAGYLRLDNLNLAYNFKPTRMFQTIKVFLAANNVFVITPYKGLDPEIQVSGTQSYIDASYTGGNKGDSFYPKTRSFTLGFTTSFK